MPRTRTNPIYQVRYALTHPARIRPHMARLARDTVLRLRTRGDHVSYYREVMRHDTARNPEAAVGSKRHDRWLALGQMQFDYLREHGLAPEHRMLEIGCGNLRAGRLFVDYLDEGNYYGLDISPDIIFSGQETLVRYGLQGKLPHLTPVRDLRLEFLPDEHFDVVHAHSVFSHSPLSVIEECFAHVGRVLKPSGYFDFTFGRTDARDHHVMWEAFFYRTETLLGLAREHGLAARFMDDWEKRPHKQSKIRVTRA